MYYPEDTARKISSDSFRMVHRSAAFSSKGSPFESLHRASRPLAGAAKSRTGSAYTYPGSRRAAPSSACCRRAATSHSVSSAPITPFACILLESFRTESTGRVGYIIPKQWGFDNYINLWTKTSFPIWFRNTLIIAVCAAVLGVILGFLTAFVRVTHDKNHSLGFLNAICKLYLTIVRGTPMMIQLLIMYYVIFKSVNVDKVFVAVIAFAINSGAYVAEIFRSGMMSVDNGQFEAGRSLGLSYRITMLFIVLPQAVKNVLPALCNEFITLLKETSICGYIGLNDLTRGGDIIRSNTFDAFMPLILVAAIYLIFVELLSMAVSKMERSLRKNER